MSEQEQPNETVMSDEDKDRIKNAFFSKMAKILPAGVLIKGVNLKEEEVDMAISNEDIADIYNAINGESPYDETDDSK